MQRLILRAPRFRFGGGKGLPDIEPDTYVNEAEIAQHNNLDAEIRRTGLKTAYEVLATGATRPLAQTVR